MQSKDVKLKYKALHFLDTKDFWMSNCLQYRFLVIRGTMSGPVVKEVAYGARRVSIVLAEEIKDKGFKRPIDAIDPALITQTADKVANAFSGSSMITAS